MPANIYSFFKNKTLISLFGAFNWTCIWFFLPLIKTIPVVGSTKGSRLDFMRVNAKLGHSLFFLAPFFPHLATISWTLCQASLCLPSLSPSPGGGAAWGPFRGLILFKKGEGLFIYLLKGCLKASIIGSTPPPHTHTLDTLLHAPVTH